MAEPIIVSYRERGISKGDLSSFKPLLDIGVGDRKKIECLLDSGADSSISFKLIGGMLVLFKF